MSPAQSAAQPGSVRIGTWNLDGRAGPRQRDFLESLGCDVLLLTEVPDGVSDDVDWSPWAIHLSEASIRSEVRYAAVATRGLPLHPCLAPTPHPASAVTQVGGWRFCSSVLPWRGSGGDAPWSGGDQAARTGAACDQILEGRPDVWGGDWNHAMQGRDWAGSRGGRAAIEDVVRRLGLHVATGALPAAGDGQGSVDHIAVPQSAVVGSAERVVARDERGRLSDHDAYVVVVS